MLLYILSLSLSLSLFPFKYSSLPTTLPLFRPLHFLCCCLHLSFRILCSYHQRIGIQTRVDFIALPPHSSLASLLACGSEPPSFDFSLVILLRKPSFDLTLLFFSIFQAVFFFRFLSPRCLGIFRADSVFLDQIRKLIFLLLVLICPLYIKIRLVWYSNFDCNI